MNGDLDRRVKADRIILHLDMDSYYASVEVARRPELAKKPVIVGADPVHGTGRGVVVTCTYEARAFGVRSAMPISQAYRLCPDAVYLAPDFACYAQVSAGIMGLLKSYGFRFQQVSIDEAFLDASPLGSFDAAGALAGEIKSEIRKSFGITCSVGIGPSKVVAKIASDFRKPDGCTIVKPGEVPAFLAPMPVRKIPGIGAKAEAELFELGIRTIGDLAQYDVQPLISRFGRAGTGLHEIALGIDESEVAERDGARSLSRETTFPDDTDDPEKLASTMDALAIDLHRMLVEDKLRFRTITVKVRYQGFVTKTRAKTISHYSDDQTTIRSGAQALLQSLYDGRKIRLLGLRLSGFETRDAGQTTLF